MIRLISKKEIPGQRANIPGWLADPEQPAPCLCGQPLHPNEPHIVAVGEAGLKRWFHASCWQMMMDNGDDDEDDED